MVDDYGCLSSTQLVEQRLRLLQIGGVDPLGEPAVDGSEKVPGFVITGRGTRYAAAPGMAVFYPTAPLKTGVRVSVAFKREDGKEIGRWSFRPK